MKKMLFMGITALLLTGSFVYAGEKKTSKAKCTTSTCAKCPHANCPKDHENCDKCSDNTKCEKMGDTKNCCPKKK